MTYINKHAIILAMNTLLTQSAVLARPGWSRGLLTSLLGEPDVRKKLFGRRAMCSLFGEDRVVAAEQTEDFLAAQAGLQKRKNAARKAVDTKIVRLMTDVAAMPVSVCVLPLKVVQQRAIDDFNDRLRDDSEPATTGSDTAFLNRIAVNHIRHTLTEYDFALEEVAGRTGVQAAVAMIRVKVYEAIAVAYPVLAGECRRQRAVRNIP